MATYPYNVDVPDGKGGVESHLYKIEANSPEEAQAALMEFLNPQQPQQPEAPPPQPNRFGGMMSTDRLLRGDTAEAYMPPISPDAAASPRDFAAGAARVPIGMGQLATDLTFNDELKKNYEVAARDTLDQIRGRPYDESSPQQWISERAAEMLVSAPLAVASKSAQLWGVIKNASKIGFIGGASMYEEGADLSDKLVSGTFGMLGGAVTSGLIVSAFNREVAPGVMSGKFGYWKDRALNWLTQRNMKNGDKAQQAAIENLTELAPEMAEKLTLGQRSGSLAQQDNEARAAAQHGLVAMREQMETMYTTLKRLGAEKYGAKWNPVTAAAEYVKRGDKVWRAELANMAGVRRANWEGGIGAAEAAVTYRTPNGALELVNEAGITGAKQHLFGMETLNDRIVQFTDDWATSKLEFSPQIKKLLHEYKTFEGGVSFETLLKTLKASNGENFRVLAGDVSEAAQERAGKEIRKILLDAIEQSPDTSDAVRFLKQARATYAVDSDKIDAFMNSSAAIALGSQGRKADPERAIIALREMSQSESYRARQLLEKHDPELLRQAKSLMWNDAIQSATNPGNKAMGAAGPIFDPAKFIQQMMDGDTLKASGLYNETEIAMMRQLAPGVRAIFANKGMLAKYLELEAASMTAADMAGKGLKGAFGTAAFAARQAFRMSSFLDKRYFTKEGRQILESTIAAVGTPRAEAAMARLFAYAKASAFGDPFDPDAE